MSHPSVKIALMALCLLTAPAGCAGDTASVPVGNRVAALEVPGLVPVPCSAPGKLSWKGSASALLVADAWAACGRNPSGTVGTEFDVGSAESDAYLDYVRTQMEITTGSVNGVLKAWLTLRKDPTKNCDPDSKQPTGDIVDLEDPNNPPVQEWMDLPPPSPIAEYQRVAFANADLRGAGVNYCIAQRLRAWFPGAAAASALFLSEADQRELLQVIRDRAQLAVLQYATLAVMFSTPYQGSPTAPTCEQRIPLLQDWAIASAIPGPVGDARKERLKAMGKDFAGALQLLVSVSTEFADLLIRSRSKRASTGVLPQTSAEEAWGAGSWYQRLLVLLYGGDPLADATGGIQPNAAPTPGYKYASEPPWLVFGDTRAESWPSPAWAPYVSTSLGQPQVKGLLDLARQHNALTFNNDLSASACRRIDSSAAAGEAFYERVEHALRKFECVGPTCATLPPPAAPFPNEKYLLWEKHGIRPEHALLVVQYFSESFNDRKGQQQCVAEYPDAQELQAALPGVSFVYPYTGVRPGTQNIRGTVEVTPTSTLFSSDMQFLQRGLAELAPEFARLGSWRIPAPWEVRPFVAAQFMGLPDPCGAYKDDNEHRRRMGVIGALVAARQAIADSIAYLNLLNGYNEQSRRDDFLKESKGMLELIGAAVGDGGVSVKPVLKELPLSDGGASWMVNDNDQVAVEVTFPEADDWWKSEWSGGPTGVVHAIFSVERPTSGSGNAFYPEFATNLALEPSAIIDVDPGPGVKNVTIADMAEEAFNQQHLAFAYSLPPNLQSEGMRNRWVSLPLRLSHFGFLDPTTMGLEHVRTLVAARWDGALPFDWKKLSYRLVASNVSIVGLPNHAQYFAFGGTLTELGQTQSRAREDDPSIPAFDAFGLKTNWVPPLDAGLLGGAPGESSVPMFLELAEKSADDASSAVEKAIDGLLAEAQDKAAHAAAEVRAQEALREAKEVLCGIDNGNCDTSLKPTGLPVPSYSANCADTTVQGQIKCFVSRRLQKLPTVHVGNAVVTKLNNPTVPEFAEYTGGSLQSAFVKQWLKVRDIKPKAEQLIAVATAANGKIQAAELALQGYTAITQKACSAETMAKVEEASCSTSTSTSYGVGLSVPPSASIGVSVGESCSPAMVLQQKTKCEELLEGEPSTAQSVVVAGQDAWIGLNAAAQALTDAVGDVQLSAAEVAQLLNDAKLASRQWEVESKITLITAPSSFGLSRRYRSYDLWRAKALVDGARRYALTARRAIEARYAVNMSRLEAPEPFVAGPASWADDVYSYDLSLLPAVGLSVGEPISGGLYTNKVSDYVHNLQAFVAGFPVARPSAAPAADVDVVYLPGLAKDAVSGSDAGVGQWTFKCPAQEGWVALPASGNPQDACITATTPLAKPERAAIEFVLDPWARVNRSFVDPPFLDRYNVRWDRLAVNLIGTGIKDCTKAANKPACYSEGYLRFDLTQSSAAIVTDHNGIWTAIATPRGRIEGGKALAAELWLDPLKDGWSTQYVAAVARTEFNLRPTGGGYRLELAVGPEVRLDRLEQVQILVGTNYWVKQ